MWAIRVLKGPSQGQTFKLNSGETKVGRSPTCQIQIASGGMSKEHARFVVTPDGLKISDLQSRNGIFVNGLKIKSRPLKFGDKILLHDVLLEVIDARSINAGQFPAAQPVAQGNLAMQWEPEQNGVTTPVASSPTTPAASFNAYLENVIMPGVYRLAEVTDFKYVIGMFVFAFVLLVTFLSVIPMTQLMKSGLEKESQRRALTIAQALHDRFQIASTSGMTGSFDTRFAEREPGVKAAFIISSDGSILAPVSRAGAFANQPFVSFARKSDERIVNQIDSDLIGASVPIERIDPETGLRQPFAFAMIIYDMGSLAVDSGQVISLFVRVLSIALVLGFALFVLLYKLMEAPFNQLQASLDQSLRKGDTKIENSFKLESFQNLIVSLNSLVSRTGKTSLNSVPAQKDIYSEVTPIIRSMHNPAYAIDSSGRILVANTALAQILNTTVQNIEGIQVHQIQDEAISSLSKEIFEQSQQTGTGATTPIHIQGRDLELSLHPIRSGDQIDYYILSLYDPNRDEVPT